MYYPIFTKDVILRAGTFKVKKIFDEIYNRCSENDRKGIGEFFDGTLKDASDTYLKQKGLEILERFGRLGAKKQTLLGFDSKIDIACYDFMMNYKEYLIRTLLIAAKKTAADATDKEIVARCVLICDIAERIFSKILDPSKIKYSNILIKLLIDFTTRLELEEMLFKEVDHSAFRTSLLTTHRDKIEKLQTEVERLKLAYAPISAVSLLNQRVEALLNMIRTQLITRMNPDMTALNISISDLNLDYLKKSALKQCESHYKNNSNEKSISNKTRSTTPLDNNKIEQLRTLLCETEDLKKICQKISSRIIKLNWAAFLIDSKTDEMIEKVIKKIKSKSYNILDIASNDPILKTKAGNILLNTRLIGNKFLNVEEFDKALKVVMDRTNRTIVKDEIMDETAEVRIAFDLTLAKQTNQTPIISESTDKKSVQEIKVVKEEVKCQEETKRNIEDQLHSKVPTPILNDNNTDNSVIPPTLQQRSNAILEYISQQQKELQIQNSMIQQDVSSPSFFVSLNNHHPNSPTQNQLQVVCQPKVPPIPITSEPLVKGCKSTKRDEELYKEFSISFGLNNSKEHKSCFSTSCVIQ